MQVLEDDEISIHTLREEGDTMEDDMAGVKIISIHALHEEGDTLPLSPP